MSLEHRREIAIAAAIAVEEIAAGVAANPRMTEVLMIFSDTEKFNLARKAWEGRIKS